ncbi:siroheme synthase [Desulfovibrio sp. X2]|uniref:precorrin-2 dehydrogenase/sirohydrochlorin ferrochelatase family protein n=1 Tax=Desulfovibrio sp. X2 TaxID=941449 RepID=UPI000358BF5C|nr:bifunctional precorrin-2 dehydrogenase/sirohydrochlorin ferrochelatase [Desulfovibrio sp. X2]EPR42316.1 siroheme synthase [Desulfovibrio sp. X2]
MRYYPIFVNLTDKDCLVVGAGAVGRRKIGALLDRGPRSVLVVDTRPPADDMAALLDNPRLCYETRTFRDEDVDGKFIVIASTDNEELNWRISNLCKDRGILCNIVDQPEKCSFIVPAVVSKGDLTLAVSTGGASPALAKKIRRDLEEYFGSNYGDFLILMARLRPHVLGLERGTEHNTVLFRDLVASDLLSAFERNDAGRAREILAAHLPAEISGRIDEVLDGLF